MMKLIGLVIGFLAAAAVGWQVVYAQSPSPSPSLMPSPSPTNIIDEVEPEGAPQTGLGGLSQ